MTDSPKPSFLGVPGFLGAQDELTDAQRAENQVRSAMDSVNLINQLIATGSKAERDLNTIRRNVEHLKIVVARDVVKNSTEDLAPLNAAAAAGDTYLAAASAPQS
jgi:hypothetical protein